MTTPYPSYPPQQPQYPPQQFPPQQFPPRPYERRYRPGTVAVVLVAAGVVLALFCFFVLPWYDKGGHSVSFLKIRKGYVHSDDEGVAKMYAIWAGFAALAIATAFSALAAVGLGTVGPTIVMKVLGVLSAVGAGLAHWLGFWQIFYDPGMSSAALAPWLLFFAYGLMAVGAAVGARPARPPYGYPGR
jgi:hypothetical protein